MAQAYLAGGKRSIRALAAACGVSPESASRAISQGWPERRWPSLKERAELYDKQGRPKKAEPLTTEEIQTLKVFLGVKVESANNLRAISGLAQNMLLKLQTAAERASADRHGTSRRVVVDVVTTGTGKQTVRRETHKTVTEDVVLPPYLPHIVQAMKMAAEVIAIAHDGVRRWMQANPGDLDRGSVKSPLTDVQLQFMVDNDGKLPPGVTREQLGWE